MKIVVFSYDKYSWLIPTFLHFYTKKWPDNPYQITSIVGTKNIPWADTAIKCLDIIEDETFLLILGDYILKDPVNTKRVMQAESLCRGDIGCIRLNAYDHLSHYLIKTDIDGYKEYPLDKPYALSLQAAIWQREYFISLLMAGESIWQMETEGSKRIHRFGKKIIWADTAIISYQAGGYIKKGRTVKSVKKWVKENW